MPSVHRKGRIECAWSNEVPLSKAKGRYKTCQAARGAHVRSAGNLFILCVLDLESISYDAVWRRDRDSNPGYPFEYTRFPSVRLKPLGHLSRGWSDCLNLTYCGGGPLELHCRAPFDQGMGLLSTGMKPFTLPRWLIYSSTLLALGVVP